VGASGAVSAVLFAFILLHPLKEVGLIFLPFFGIPSWIFGVLYLAYEYYLDKKGNDNVAHDAHFYGALFGLGFMTILKPSLWIQLLQQIGIGA
jgi:membrane associated rhomboid family serine protease